MASKIQRKTLGNWGKWLKKEILLFTVEFYIYINNCRVIEEDSTEITIEIDLFEHRKLLEDLTNSFFTKKISTRKVKKKIGHTYFVGNPFLTIKIYNGFK